MRFRLLLRVLALVVVATAMLPGSPFGEASARALRWGPPRTVDGAPYGQPVAIGAIACSAPGTCVAGDAAGRLLQSGGSPPWRVVAAGGGSPVTAVSCPASGSCFAARAAGQILSHPGSTAVDGPWVAQSVHDGPLDALACPSRSLCVALDPRGEVLVSTSPEGGPETWTTSALDPGGGPRVLACPTTSLCVVGEARGNVLSTTTPTIPSSWRRTRIDTVGIASLACPTAALCLAGDAAGDVLTSDAPASGAWVVAGTLAPDGRAVSVLSCPSAFFCAAATSTGALFTTSAPGGSTAGWSSTRLPVAPLALACVSARSCAGGTALGTVLSSVGPAGGSRAWTTVAVDGVSSLLSLACPGPRRCLAGDDAGRLLSSGDGGTSWRALPGGSGVATPAIYRLACPPGQPRCLALATAGDVPGASGQGGGAVLSFALGRPGAPWAHSRVPDPQDIFGFATVSCPLAGLCLARDEAGVVEAAAGPTAVGPGAVWQPATRAQAALLDGSCPSRAGGLCLMPGGAPGTLRLITGGPGRRGGRPARTFRLPVRPGARFTDVSCPAAAFCAALDSAGEVFTSAAPGRSPRSWMRGRPPVSGAQVSALSCPRPGRCVVTDTLGRVSVGT